MDQNFAPYSTPFSLYLKANSAIYSVVRINTLPTIATAISIVAAVLSGIFADKTGRFWVPVVAVTVPVLIGVSLLVAWDVGENGRLAAFMLTGFEGGMLPSDTFEAPFTYQFAAVSPMTMSWASVVMANDAEERAVVMASMNAIGQAIAAGTQVVQWPATSAPKFVVGFRCALATTVAQFLVVFVILFLSSRELKSRISGQKRG